MNKLLTKYSYKPSKTINYAENPMLAVDAVLNGDITTETLSIAADALCELNVYLAYCKQYNFSPEELMYKRELTVEGIVGGVGRLIKAGISKSKMLYSSTKFLPKFFSHVGLGDTWGQVGAQFAFWGALDAVIDYVAKNHKLNIDGISDLDGLTEKRKQMPSGAKYILKEQVWYGNGATTSNQVVNTITKVTTYMATVTTALKSIDDVVHDANKLSGWLSAFGKKTLGNTTTSATYTSDIIAKNGKFQITQVENKLKIALVPGGNLPQTTAIIPQIMDFYDVQTAAKKLKSKLEDFPDAVNSAVDKLKNTKSDNPELIHSIYAVINGIGKELIVLGQSTLADANKFVTDGIAAILTTRVKEK